MKKRFVPSPAIVIAIVALTVASISPATAAVKKLIGTKDIKNGAVTTAKIKKGAVTKDRLAPDVIQSGAKGETGAQGPKGDTGAKGETGAQGSKGDAGAPATTLFASVDGEVTAPTDAAIITSSGVVGAVSHPNDNGEYRVKFNKVITGCAAVATVKKNPGGMHTDGFASLHASGDTLSVRTFSNTGVPSNRDFDVAVFC